MKTNKNKKIAIVHIDSLCVFNTYTQTWTINDQIISTLLECDEIHITNDGQEFRWASKDTNRYTVIHDIFQNHQHITLHLNHEFHYPPNYEDLNKQPRGRNASAYLALASDIRENSRNQNSPLEFLVIESSEPLLKEIFKDKLYRENRPTLIYAASPYLAPEKVIKRAITVTIAYFTAIKANNFWSNQRYINNLRTYQSLAKDLSANYKQLPADIMIDRCKQLEKGLKAYMVNQALSTLNTLDKLQTQIEEKHRKHIELRKQFYSKCKFINHIGEKGKTSSFEKASKEYENAVQDTQKFTKDFFSLNTKSACKVVNHFKNLKTLEEDDVDLLVNAIALAEQNTNELLNKYNHVDQLLNEANQEADRFIQEIICRIYGEINRLTNNRLKWIFLASGDNKQAALQALADELIKKYNEAVSQNNNKPLEKEDAQALAYSVFHEWNNIYAGKITETRARFNWFAKTSKTIDFIDGLASKVQPAIQQVEHEVVTAVRRYNV